ncbi:MAG: ATP-dependent nuclease subunit B-like protein, partial [Bryobacterales bacterium]|nr:ATP-dependent nuclease subunit B-like protein [Bryobacterales bacterium]
MLVLTGPSGSGKSAFVLDRFREAVRAGRTDIRLLVPTATLVEHLRHERAREGLIFRPELIQTFSKFASSLAVDARLVSRPLFYVIVEDALRRVAPGEFARVSDAPGFPASVAQTIEMLDAAGCDAAALARLRSDAPLGPALALVWREVAEQLRARGLVTRAGLLRRAARGNTSVREIWFDGFGAFSDPELELVEALGKSREIVVTLPLDGASLATRARFVRMGVEVRERQATKNDGLSHVRFVADSVEREVEEIARRILDSGREFREIGVALRNPERYAGL